MAFQQVLAADPGHWRARWQMALIQGFQGDFDGSLEGLKKLVSEYPHELEIRNDLAMTYNMLGYSDEACAEFRAILQANPEHENALRQVKFC
jgi:thioredoxin-like negative regulator of GroEL